MPTHRNFFSNTQHRKPIKTKTQYPQVTVREMAYWHPCSVFESLLCHADWISRLNISRRAKHLSRLSGRQFRVAVEQQLAHH
jgi:hypothetical protein